MNLIKNPFKKKKSVPDQKEIENLMEESEDEIAKTKREKEQFSKMIHSMLVNSYMSGHKTAEIQGTKKDKLFLMVIIDSALSAIATGAIVLYLFLL